MPLDLSAPHENATEKQWTHYGALLAIKNEHGDTSEVFLSALKSYKRNYLHHGEI